LLAGTWGVDSELAEQASDWFLEELPDSLSGQVESMAYFRSGLACEDHLQHGRLAGGEAVNGLPDRGQQVFAALTFDYLVNYVRGLFGDFADQSVGSACGERAGGELVPRRAASPPCGCASLVKRGVAHGLEEVCVRVVYLMAVGETGRDLGDGCGDGVFGVVPITQYGVCGAQRGLPVAQVQCGEGGCLAIGSQLGGLQSVLWSSRGVLLIILTVSGAPAKASGTPKPARAHRAGETGRP
jgi:hypothetical protein